MSKRALMIAGTHLPGDVVALRTAFKAENGRAVTASRFQAAKKENVLEMFIYGQIGQSFFEDGVGASDVAQALKEAGKIDRIALRVNSPGGSVFEGAAIFTQLKAAGVPIDVRVDGLAASAAFTIAMAGDTIEVGEAAMMMLHNAWGMSIGEADDMRREADLLDKISQQMAGIYAARSGQTIDDVTTMMKAETWLGPQDAVDKGFANNIVKSAPKESAKAMAARFDLKMFARHVPDTLKMDGIGADGECLCPCVSCVQGHCKDCTVAECEYDGCDHDAEDDDEDMSVKPDAQAGTVPLVAPVTPPPDVLPPPVAVEAAPIAELEPAADTPDPDVANKKLRLRLAELKFNL